MKRKAFSREEREQMILDVMYRTAIVKGNISWTVYKMAKKLNMTPSPHLRGIMIGMVEKHMLSAAVREHRRGVLKTVFWIPNRDFYNKPDAPSRREVLINGKRVWFE